MGVGLFWRVFKVVRVALVFAAFYGGGAIFGFTVLPLVWITRRDPVDRIRAAQYALANTFRFFIDWMRAFRLFSLRPREVDQKLPERPCILVVNHPTTIDVVAMLSVYRNACVVVKHKIWTNPLLRWVFRWCGHIDGGDGSFASNQRMVEEVQQRIDQGFSVAIWPEGTRSPPGQLGTMHRGAFSVAVTHDLPILPIVIRANPPVLHKEAPWYVWPKEVVDYTITAGELIETGQRGSRQVLREVEGYYRRELGIETPLEG